MSEVTTLAGLGREFGEPFGLACLGDDIFVSDGAKGTISIIRSTGQIDTFASGLNTPSGIAFDAAGTLYVADTGSNTVKAIDRNGKVSVAAGVENMRGIQDGPASSALFNGPVGIAIDATGRIVVADTYNDRIRVIENGTVRTLSGGARGLADGPGIAALFDTPLGLAIWHNDKILVADSSNKRIRVIEPDGYTWTLAGFGSDGRDGSLGEAGMTDPTALAVDTDQNIYVADGDRIRVIGRHTFPIVESLTSERQGYSDGPRRKAQFNRPSGITVTDDGSVIVADSDDLVVRQMSDNRRGAEADEGSISKLQFSADEFRLLQPARWPFDPPGNKREIAGTLAEVRGEVGPDDKPSWFHNGLDIAGGYGEVARFVRDETVLDPHAVQNVGTTRELIRMPTMGYIHIRLGRDQNDRFMQETPFQAEIETGSGKILHLRVPRGTHFQAGDRIGTLNSLNHVHLIAGRSGAEMNALAALILPGVSDSIAPVIESTAIVDQNWNEIETRGPGGRINLTEKSRVVVRAYDRVDGNAERRRLGVYKLGFRIFRDAAQAPDIHWGIIFDRMPPADAVPFVYAPGSQSGYSGTTVFNYIVTNDVGGGHYSEGFIDPAALDSGVYTLEVFAADIFGNTTSKTTQFEVTK